MGRAERIRTYIFLVVFVTFALQAQASVCENDNVISIERPVLSNQTSSKNFNFKFNYTKRESPDATVVIFVPGGPGQTSMEMPMLLPSEFAVVRIDPRGVGCNKVDLPAESLTSNELARDILAVVREIKPKRYILHGISYGSVVATMAAAFAESEGVQAPAAVVLEGTMGKVFNPNEYSDGYLLAWKKLKSELPNEVVSQFAGAQFPLGFTSIEWATWVSQMLVYGISPSGDSLIKDNLLFLKPEFKDGKQLSLVAQMNRIKTQPSAEKTKLYKEIVCQELVPDVRDVKFDFDFVGGDLVDRSIRLCGPNSLTRPFDSKSYQIRVPIYYFSGGLDPATPKSQARYHFENQIGRRTLISVENGGHQALSMNLMDCAESIWKAIDADDSSRLDLSISTCGSKNFINVERQEYQPRLLRILDNFLKIYAPIVKNENSELAIEIKKNSMTADASADFDGKKMKLVLSEGMIVSSKLSEDGLRFTLCHEMGHILGGAPRKNTPFDWTGPVASDGLSLMSSEGQADFYAAAVCFKEIVKTEDNRGYVKSIAVSAALKGKCDNTWGADSENSAICIRTALGAYNMFRLSFNFPIAFEKSDDEVAANTIKNTYPSRQCRLDTVVAGANCKKSGSFILDFNDETKNDCLEQVGLRPACWYKR